MNLKRYLINIKCNLIQKTLQNKIKYICLRKIKIEILKLHIDKYYDLDIKYNRFIVVILLSGQKYNYRRCL